MNDQFASVPRSVDGFAALANHLRAFASGGNPVADTVLVYHFLGLIEQLARSHAAR